MLGINVAHAEGNLLGARDFQALAFLYHADEIRRIQQRVVGAGIEPGCAPGHDLHREIPPLQVNPVDVGDLKLTPG